MYKFLAVIDRWKNRLFVLLTSNQSYSLKNFQGYMGHEVYDDPESMHPLGEQELELSEHLQRYLDALDALEAPGEGEGSRAQILLEHVFRAGMKFGVEHATEICVRQIRL